MAIPNANIIRNWVVLRFTFLKLNGVFIDHNGQPDNQKVSIDVLDRKDDNGSE